jgi:protein O-mannosyl-transferase
MNIRRLHFWMTALIIALGVIAYWNSFSGVFVLDDRRMILENEIVLRPWPLGDVLFGIRPILNLTLALNYALTGLNVWSYHAVNLLIHILAGLVLFGIVRRTLEKVVIARSYSSTGLAFTISLLWLVHPLLTQSVTYLIQRAESLMGLFYLLVIYCAIRANDSPKAIGWYFSAVLSFALGMGTKEVMVTAPFTLLLYDRIFLAASWKEVFRRRWGLHLGLLAALGISMTSFLLKYVKWAAPTAGFAFDEITPLQYAVTQPGVVLHYLRLAFWPDPLAFDYYWPIADSLGEILIPGFFIALLFGMALRALFFRPPLGFLSIWFFFILAPTSSIMPIADIAFEHRMYLSLISPVALAVIGAQAVLNRFIRSVFWRTVSGIGLLTLIAMLLMSLTRFTKAKSESG